RGRTRVHGTDTPLASAVGQINNQQSFHMGYQWTFMVCGISSGFIPDFHTRHFDMVGRFNIGLVVFRCRLESGDIRGL
ncbi:MAG: hypothetical protein ACKN9W_12700, partial [Methylococcus sp.]